MNLDPRTIFVSTDRQRRDLGDLTTLKASIAEFGIIEPLVVTQAQLGNSGATSYVLVAGERRLRSALDLGLSEVPCHLRADLAPWQAEAMELEENYNRKQLTWQETVVAIARVHDLHKTDAALNSKPWGCEHTAALFGISSGNVSYSTQLAAYIKAGDADIIACDGVWAAYELLRARKANAAMAEQARRISLLPAQFTIAPSVHIVGKPDCVACGGTGRASNGKPCTCATVTVVPARECMATPVTAAAGGLRITLSNEPFDTFSTRARAGFDHIYTDPPYAIDMDNIEQANVGMNVSAVRSTHDVTDNIALLGAFMQWACDTLPPHGFLVAWCDYTMWETLGQWASVGERKLRLQRWPFIWTKTSPCQNGAAYSNFTKTTECAFVAAGEKATLATAGPLGHWIGAADKGAYAPTNPFWKPLDLHHAILDAISRPGQTICDPFAGSGSIPLACQRHGRNVLANEMDAVHYNDMTSRLQQPATPTLL